MSMYEDSMAARTALTELYAADLHHHLDQIQDAGAAPKSSDAVSRRSVNRAGRIAYLVIRTLAGSLTRKV